MTKQLLVVFRCVAYSKRCSIGFDLPKTIIEPEPEPHGSAVGDLSDKCIRALHAYRPKLYCMILI